MLPEEAVATLAEAGHPVSAFVGDVSQRDDQFALVDHAVKTFGRLDVFVNNAGVEGTFPLDSLTQEIMERLFAINVYGVVYGMQAAAAQMRAQGGGGKIINAASTASESVFPNTSAFTATKRGVSALTEFAALEYAPDKITVNAYGPGPVLTAASKAYLEALARENGTTLQDELDVMSNNVPLGRWAQPSDIAGLVSYLASSDGDYVTGRTVIIDGGLIL